MKYRIGELVAVKMSEINDTYHHSYVGVLRITETHPNDYYTAHHDGSDKLYGLDESDIITSLDRSIDRELMKGYVRMVRELVDEV